MISPPPGTIEYAILAYTREKDRARLAMAEPLVGEMTEPRTRHKYLWLGRLLQDDDVVTPHA